VKEVFILLGSNRGDRQALLHQASELIKNRCGPILKFSSVYETEPWGFEDETSFLNQVVEIETSLPAEELLVKLREIEALLGRTQTGHLSLDIGKKSKSCKIKPMSNDECPMTVYSSRTIDLDILFYGRKMIFTENLMIPHPRLHHRRFTLEPLNEIAPSFQHPVLKKSISHLLGECNDSGEVTKYKG